VAAAARRAGIDLAQARLRFPCRMAIIARFGRLADAAALEGALTEGTVKDRLFDLLMRRIDFLQQHRAGVKALMRFAPLDPGLSLYLAQATLLSMGWMLEGAGVSAQGVLGLLRRKGLGAVWAWTIRAWLRDDSEDLSATMAALDAALTRADQVARGLPMERSAVPAPEPAPEPDPLFDEPVAEDAPFVPPSDAPEQPK